MCRPRPQTVDLNCHASNDGLAEGGIETGGTITTSFTGFG
jgi:hypothetical protein